MADGRRWDAASGVRREDEFTRGPSFRDGLDSAPLAADRAAWHGGSHHGSSPAVAFAVGLAFLAAAAAIGFMVLDPGGGADPVDAGSAAAEDGGPGIGGSQPLGAAGNGTSLPPLPTGLPPVPTPAMP